MSEAKENSAGVPRRLASVRGRPFWSVSVKSAMDFGRAITVTRSRAGSGAGSFARYGCWPASIEQAEQQRRHPTVDARPHVVRV